MNVWTYIHSLLGPGSVWDKPRAKILTAIDKATADGNEEALGHLKLILARHDEVFMVKKEPRPKSGQNPR